MTREEAITIIDNLHLIGCGRNQHECDIKTNEALDMAIEALHREEAEANGWCHRIRPSNVGLVRCKDCKWRCEDDCPMYHEEWFTIDEGFGFLDDDYHIIDNTTDNGFCHRGERREP